MSLEHLWFDPSLLQAAYKGRVPDDNWQWINQQLVTLDFNRPYFVELFDQATQASNFTAAWTKFTQKFGHEAPFASQAESNAYLEQVDDLTLKRIVRQGVFGFTDDHIDFTLTREEYLSPNFIHSEDSKTTPPIAQNLVRVKDYFVAELALFADATDNEALAKSNRRKFAAFTRAINSPSYGFTDSHKVELFDAVYENSERLVAAGIDAQGFKNAFFQLLPCMTTDDRLKQIATPFEDGQMLQDFQEDFYEKIKNNIIKLLANGVTLAHISSDYNLVPFYEADDAVDVEPYKLVHDAICENLPTLQHGAQAQTLANLYRNGGGLDKGEYQGQIRTAINDHLVTLAKNGVTFADIQAFFTQEVMPSFVAAATAATTAEDVLALQGALAGVAAALGGFNNAVIGRLDALLDSVDSSDKLGAVKTCMQQANADDALLQDKLQVPSVFAKLIDAGLSIDQIAGVHGGADYVRSIKNSIVRYDGLLAHLDAGLSLTKIVEIANHNKAGKAYTREDLRDVLLKGIPDDASIEVYEKIHDFVKVNDAGNIMGVTDDADLKKFYATLGQQPRIKGMLDAVKDEGEFTRTINLLESCDDVHTKLIKVALNDIKLVCALVLKGVPFAALSAAFGADGHDAEIKPAATLEGEVYAQIGEDHLKETADLIKLQKVTLADGNIGDLRKALAQNFPERILKLDDVNDAAKLQALIDLVQPLNEDAVTRSIGNADDPLKLKIVESLKDTETFAKMFAHAGITIKKMGELLTGSDKYADHADVTQPHLDVLQRKIADYIVSIKKEGDTWTHTKPGATAEEKGVALQAIKDQLDELRKESERYNEDEQSLGLNEAQTAALVNTCRGSMALMKAIDATNYQKLVQVYGKGKVEAFTRIKVSPAVKTSQVLGDLQKDLDAATDNGALQTLLDKVKQQPTTRASQRLRLVQVVAALRNALRQPGRLLDLLNKGVTPKQIVAFHNDLPGEQGPKTIAINNIVDDLKRFMQIDFAQLTQVMKAVNQHDLATETFTDHFDKHFVEWVGENTAAAEAMYTDWKTKKGHFGTKLQADTLSGELLRRRQLLQVDGAEAQYVAQFNHHYRALPTDADRELCKKEVYGDDINSKDDYGRLPDFFIHSQDFSIDSIAAKLGVSDDDKSKLNEKLDAYITKKLGDISPASAKALAAMLHNPNLPEGSVTLITSPFSSEETVKAWLEKEGVEVEILRSLGVSDALIRSAVMSAADGSTLAGKKQSVLAKTQTLAGQRRKAYSFLQVFSKFDDAFAAIRQSGLPSSTYMQVCSNAYQEILKHPELIQADGMPSTEPAHVQKILDIYKQEIANYASSIETLNANMLPKDSMQDYDDALVKMQAAAREVKKLKRQADKELNFTGIIRVVDRIQTRADELKGIKTEESRKSLVHLKAAIDKLDRHDFAKSHTAEQQKLSEMLQKSSEHMASLSSLAGASIDQTIRTIIKDLVGDDATLMRLLEKTNLWDNSPFLLFDAGKLTKALKDRSINEDGIEYANTKLAAIRKQFIRAMHADLVKSLKSEGVTSKPMLYYDTAHKKKLSSIADSIIEQYQTLSNLSYDLQSRAKVKFNDTELKQELGRIKADVEGMLAEREEEAVKGKRAVIFARQAPESLDYGSVHDVINGADATAEMGVSSQQYEEISVASPEEVEDTNQIVKLKEDTALVVSVKKVENARSVTIKRDSVCQLDKHNGVLKRSLLNKAPGYKEKSFADSALTVGRALALSYISAMPKANPYYFSANTKSINITGKFEVKHGRFSKDNTGLLELAIMKVCLTELTKQGYTVDRATPAYQRYERALSTNSGYLMKNAAFTNTKGILQVRDGVDTEHVLPAERGTCAREAEHDDDFEQEVSRHINPGAST